MHAARHIALSDAYATFADIPPFLESEGFRVTAAEDGQALRRTVANDAVDLVLLNIRCPDEDGFGLARYISEHHRCGLIMLAARADAMDRIVGLEVGADDLMAAPVAPRELLARVRSVLRRVAATAQPASAPVRDATRFRFGRFELDATARLLTAGEAGPVELTGGEFALLRAFLTRPGEVLSREVLTRAVHGRAWDYYDRSIDVLVTRLRAKLDTDPAQPLLRTVRGAGYVLSAKVDAS